MLSFCVYIYISYIDPDNWYVISTDDIGHQPQQPHQAPAASGLRCLQPGSLIKCENPLYD